MTDSNADAPTPAPAVMTAEELADLLRISLWKLYRDIRDHRLPDGLEPLPIGKPYRWSVDAVHQALRIRPRGLSEEG